MPAKTDMEQIMAEELKSALDTAMRYNMRYKQALIAIAGSEDVGMFAPARAAQAALGGANVCLAANGKFHIYTDGDKLDKQDDELEPCKARDRYKHKFEWAVAQLNRKTNELAEAYRLLHEEQDSKDGE